MQTKVQITFELVSIPKELAKDLFGGTKNKTDSLYEALCKAILEQDQTALEWLTSNVSDIN
jgi:hypothetical protein